MSRALSFAVLRGCVFSFLPLSWVCSSHGQVMMNVSTQPYSGVAGVTTVNAIGSRFPTDHGALVASGMTLTLSSSCGGPALATASAQSVVTVLGSQRRVGFVVPSSMLAGTYFVSLTGKAVDGTTFSSLSGSCSEVAVTHVNTAQTGCVASGTLSVNAPPKGGTVTAYAANGCWECAGDKYKGVQAVNIEGPTLSSSIGTRDVVNACATNSVTGQTVCTANGTDVYLLQDRSLITTLQSGSSGRSTIGGAPNNFGVVINPVTNQAVLGIGLDRNNTGVSTGLQVLDLGTNTFASPVPSKNKVSDEILIDPARGFVLSPNDSGNYDIFSMKPDSSGTEFSNQLPAFEDWDSAAEDCSTGIALAPSESSSGDIYIADLTQLQFSPDKSTWTAPSQLLPLKLGMQTIAIAPGDSHLGILAPEYVNGGKFTVIQLPSSSGTGTPTIVDYVQGNIPGFLGTPDPHSITAYTSPNDGKSYGLVASSFPATDLARLDLGCILAQPRTADQHNLSAYAASCIKIFSTGNAPPAPPVITSTPRATTAASVVYEDKIYVTAANNFPLSFALLSGPAGLSIDAASGLLHWVPAPAQVGNQPFTVRVTDVFGLTATATFQVNVFVVQNKPPVITSTPSTRTVVGTPYTYQVTATDANPASLRYSLSAAPTGVSIDALTGLLQWTPSVGLANQTANITLQVTDANFLYASQSFQLALVPTANHPPVIISNPAAIATVGQTYTYQVRATDPDNDPLAYSLISAPLGTTLDPATGLLQWTPVSTDTGDLSVSVRAQDPGALVATQTFALHVQRAYPVPTIAIASPTPGSLLNKPADIIATISDPTTTGPPISWTVDLLRGDNSTQRIGSGSGAVSGAAIAHLDPTLIRDDSYSVVITVGKDGQEDSKSFDYNVSSNNLKLGNFTTSFTDISIPVAGIPLTITRVYNSVDTGTGEFGAGWRLGLPGQVVDSARETPLEPFTASTRVYITRPDGIREGFTFAPTQPTPFLPVYMPGFKADAGVTDTLTVDPQDLANAGGAYYVLLGGPYNPSTYRLTTKYGVEYTIDELAGLQQVKDRNGNTLTVTPSGIQSSSGLSLPIEHDNSGRITRITEPGGGYVHYAYDSSGNLSSSFDQMGNETKYSYDNPQFPHYLTAIVDPLGRPVTRNVYDANGRLIAQCDPSGDPVSLTGCVGLSPDVDARTQTIVNGRGFETDLLLSDTGNVLTERHWLDEEHFLDTLYTYDPNNNLTGITDPAGNLTIFDYDQTGNMLSETMAGSLQFRRTYNSCNLVSSSTDALGAVTKYDYDAACNLISRTDAVGAAVKYDYDSHGKVTDLHDPVGNHWHWSYDQYGHLQATTDPLGSKSTFSFSAAGDLLWRVDRNSRRIDLAYNSRHLPLSETWDSNVQGLAFQYDPAGEVTSVRNESSSLAFSYDGAGRVTTINNAGTLYVPPLLFSYGYDANGNTVSVRDTLGGSTDYTYDALDRNMSIRQSGGGTTAIRADLAYDGADLLTSLGRYADVSGSIPVVTTTYTYQCGGCSDRLTDIVHRQSGSNNVVQAYHLQRDARGNIFHSTDSDGEHSYSYDGVSRLKSATHSNSLLLPPETYSYDAAGNRTNSHLSGTYTYSYQTGRGGNQLVADSTYSYAYDGEGNLARRTNVATGKIEEYTYDPHNRLVEISNRPGALLPIERTLSLKYDAGGRLLAVTDGTTTTAWQYDGANPVLTFAPGNTLISRNLYTRSVDQLIAETTSQETHWDLHDQVGTVHASIDNSGKVLGKRIYDSFGNIVQSEGDPGSFSFQSRYALDVDLLDFRRRAYRPSLGRFLQEDYLEPFHYLFASGNPMTRVDPFGGQDTAEYKETEEETATNIPCEKHHFFPKYVIGYDNGVAWNVTRASHRAFHKWFALILPFGGAPLPEEQAADLLEWAYEMFPLEACPGSDLYDVIPYRGISF